MPAVDREFDQRREDLGGAAGADEADTELARLVDGQQHRVARHQPTRCPFAAVDDRGGALFVHDPYRRGDIELAGADRGDETRHAPDAACVVTLDGLVEVGRDEIGGIIGRGADREVRGAAQRIDLADRHLHERLGRIPPLAVGASTDIGLIHHATSLLHRPAHHPKTTSGPPR